MDLFSYDKAELKRRYRAIRDKTVELCQPLVTEDYVIQTCKEVSPPKWHLAHTTWFFENFLLKAHQKNFKPYHDSFHFLFNSYYHSLGNFHPQERRGFLSRPTVKTIYEYREFIDNKVLELIDKTLDKKSLDIVILGLNHEQQHQELLLMDIKHNFYCDPNFISYADLPSSKHSKKIPKLDFFKIAGGFTEIGHANALNFCFDNELPRYPQILQPYVVAKRLITNGEYLEFINAGGYLNPTLWLSDGWDCVKKNKWKAPLYWQYQNKKWHVFTLNGLQALILTEPVIHVSYYEAAAYAQWRGFRLPLETEWEHAVISHQLDPVSGNFLEDNQYHPVAAEDSDCPQQFFGNVWEWTASPYSAYPRYQPSAGALGEYNGKFMNNQFVLRGGSFATPRSHIRPTYRNFFQPDKRWQFCGIRLAMDS